MSSKKHNQKSEFLKLQAKWYKKIAKGPDGFNDIEIKPKKWQEQYRFSDYPKFIWDTRYEYYVMATSFLQEYTFETRREQIIWEYHANGLNSYEIARTLNKVSDKPVSHDVIYRIILRLEDVMKGIYMPRNKEHQDEQ